MRASIIIPSHNRSPFLQALLASLTSAIDDSDVEIIVVDDGSTDGTAEDLAVDFPGIRLLSVPTVRGPSYGRNRGADAAQGDLLLFLDSDGVVEEGWLDALLHADSGRHVLLGNVVDFHGGRTQSVPRRATFIGKSLPCRPESANTGPSCNLAVPRDLFQALGGFDEELPYYFEDSDLCIRAARAGHPFRFVADAVFRHHGTERKTGDAIRLQEAHSTYAMLKTYEDDILRSVTFSLANGTWLLTRAVWWTARGRLDDVALLLRGWGSAYIRYLRARY